MPDIDERYYGQIDMRAPATKTTHVVTVDYLIKYISGKIKNPVRVVSTTNLTGSYANGILSGSVQMPTIDGITLTTGEYNSSRVLLTGQTDKTQNGIYTFTQLNPFRFVRATDFDSSEDILSNVRIPVSEGTTYADTMWVLTTDGTITLDTSELNFTVDQTSISGTESYVESVTGDDATTEWDIVHNLNTDRIVWNIVDNSTKEVIYLKAVKKDANTLTVSSGVVFPSTFTFIVTIIGVD
jgi:hypothetical protein